MLGLPAHTHAGTSVFGKLRGEAGISELLELLVLHFSIRWFQIVLTLLSHERRRGGQPR